MFLYIQEGFMTLVLEDYIASVRDFPKEGILFRDVTPIIESPEALHECIRRFAEIGEKVNADVIVGPESRGFIFGCPTAYAMGKGFVAVRKPGKLPRETISCDYELEYGVNTLCMHKDSIKPGQRCLVIDDLLATGGTAQATANLIEQLCGIVAGFAFVIELDGLNGRDKLEGYDVFAMMNLSDK